MKLFKKLSKNILTNNHGMSLIEILIVITLIAGIGALVAGRVLDRFDQAKYNSTKVQINTIKGHLEDFKLRCGKYPESMTNLLKQETTPEGCDSFPKTGFVKEKDLKDQWGKEFQYTTEGGDFKIISFGKDGQEGGDGLNKDISSDDD